MLAIGCYGALDELGLRCPEDISVIGFNDMPFVDRLRPPLSSVRFPHYQLGVEAATLLIQRIEAHDSPVKVLLLAPELVARGSTTRPSGLPREGAAAPLRHGRADA
jgi:LacI family transcriptional regulator